MNLQFDDVLASLAVWAGEPQRQAFVDEAPGGWMAQARQRGPSRRRHAPDQLFERETCARARDSNDSDRRWRPAGGEGEDRIALARHI